MTELLLTPKMIVTPGWRVIERETRSKMARIAAARAEANRMRKCREMMSNA